MQKPWKPLAEGLWIAKKYFLAIQDDKTRETAYLNGFWAAAPIELLSSISTSSNKE